jgi:hypothetical protein
MKTFYLLVFSLLTASLSAQSNNNKTFYPLIEGSLHYGGDELATITFTNGDDQSMRAGQGGALAVGFEFRNKKDQHLRIRSTIGIKYNTTAADNANIRFTRFPLTVMSMYQLDSGFRVGGGVSYHLAAQFKGDDVLPDFTLNSGLGRRIEIGYKWVALVADFMNYTLDGSFENIDGFSIGISGSYVIGAD